METLNNAVILVVEDDEGLNRLIVRRLLQSGYTAESAYSGNEVLEKLSTGHYHMLILDYKLPDFEARVLIPLIKNKAPEMPFVIMTGYGDEKTAVEMMKLGAEDYFVKDTGFIDLLPPVLERVIKAHKNKAALREAENKYQRLYNSIRDAVASVNLEGVIIDCNEAFLDMLGYTFDEIRKMTYNDLTPPEWHQFERRILEEQVLVRGYSNIYEKEYIRKDGSVFPIELRTYLMKNETGTPEAMWAIIRDISDRKFVEKALRESEKKYRTLTNAIPDIIAQFDRNNRFIYVNPAVEKVTGVSVEKFIGMTHIEMGFDEPVRLLWDEKIKATFQTGVQQTMEFGINAQEGLKSLYSLLVPVLDDNGNVNSVLVVTHDITDRKKAEEQIKESLAEKETLIRELYHRTKNNMQVISSMLMLEAAYTNDKKVVEVFHSMQSRIMTMALVHQKLYQSKNLSNIDLGEYMEDLLRLLEESYTLREGSIKLERDLDNIKVLIDVAIPCGIIVNELVTNAIKYAYPDGKAGVVKVTLKHLNTGEMELTVSDNGVGIPPGYDIRKDGKMGLKTVFAIAESQLRGNLQFENKGGIAYKLSFDHTIYQERV